MIPLKTFFFSLVKWMNDREMENPGGGQGLNAIFGSSKSEMLLRHLSAYIK